MGKYIKNGDKLEVQKTEEINLRDLRKEKKSLKERLKEINEILDEAKKLGL